MPFTPTPATMQVIPPDMVSGPDNRFMGTDLHSRATDTPPLLFSRPLLS